MNNKTTFGGRLRPKKEEPKSWENLVDLPNERLCFVYQRLSSHEQVKRSIYSIKAQDALVDLAQEDGYTDEQIYVGKRDLGISGTKGREDRPELAYLIDRIEAGSVESVYVVHISRLYRDQTLINALSLGELFKEHGVIVVTPQMRLNLRDRMHMRLFRMEVERAADELELMAHRLLAARDIKARSGFYAGEVLPPGIVVDVCEKLPNGETNPDHHAYQVFEPHAKVVRTIFERLVLPGVTPVRVVRHCQQNGIVFPPFTPKWDTSANHKTFINSECNPDGSWPVTMGRVRNIATNPAYVGWKVWGGEVVAQEVYPPIVDEQTFWAVQDKFNGGEVQPKKEYDPLPLAGLLYCGNHDVPKRMTYTNRSDSSRSDYRCYDHTSWTSCINIAAHHLDGPISEAVIGQLVLSEVGSDVLKSLTNEYEAAKEQAASYRREKTRLEAEVESLRRNLAKGVMSSDQLKWLDGQIQERLARIKELADLGNQPIGAVVGHPVPNKEDIELVRELLANLGEKWSEKPNGLKNALLRLLLDRVIIWHSPERIRAKLVWRFGGKEQELLIHRPLKKGLGRWTEKEKKVLREHFESATIDELLMMLPGRTWEGIRKKGRMLGMSREARSGGPGHQGNAQSYTPHEDKLVRCYYAGGITQEEVMATGRSMLSIHARASRLGLTRTPRKATWEWLDKCVIPQGQSSTRPT